MAVIPYGAPIANVASGQMGPPIFSARCYSSNTIADADFVQIDGSHAGYIDTCAADVASGIIGIAQHGSSAVYDQIATGIQGVFGSSQENTNLFPGTPGEILVVTLGANIIVAINLPATTGWVSGGTHQANLGTEVGLNIDGTTGFFYADDQEANKVAYISQKIIGPGQGGVGDLGARVYISFIPSVLSPVTGH